MPPQDFRSPPGLYDYGKLVPIPVQRRLTSLLAGMHQGLRAGTSHEFLDMEEYKAGDPVADIDWKATARHNHPVVKRFESTAILTAYLLVDTGNNMAAAAKESQDSKLDVATELATAMSWLTAIRGDHLGLIAGNSGDMHSLPARSGIAHAQKVLGTVRTASVTGPPADVSRLVSRAGVTVSKRSIILLVTDHFQMTPTVVAGLRRLKSRHQVLVVLVEDRDPTATAGEAEDVTTGLLPDFLSTDPTIKYQWSVAHRTFTEQASIRLKQQGITFATAGSREDVLPALLKLLARGGPRGR